MDNIDSGIVTEPLLDRSIGLNYAQTMTPENLKAYMDGFEMASKKSFEETGISAEEYIERLINHNTHPIHIVTPRQMVEAAIDTNMAVEDIEQAGTLMESLSLENKQTKSH